jgi:hypothetical protein
VAYHCYWPWCLLHTPQKLQAAELGSPPLTLVSVARIAPNPQATDQKTSNGELDQIGEMKSQIEMNAQVLAQLHRSDETEHANRTRYMQHIRRNGTMIEYQGQTRPLRLLRIGFKNISYLNSPLATLTHTEGFLEKFYLEVSQNLQKKSK